MNKDIIRNNILEKIQEIYIEFWDNKELYESTDLIEDLNFDSLDRVEFIMRIENLKIVTSKTHRKEHIINKWAKKYNECIKCVSNKRNHAGHGLCTKCNQYLFIVKNRKYECVYENGKRLFSNKHKENLSKAAILKYKKRG